MLTHRFSPRQTILEDLKPFTKLPLLQASSEAKLPKLKAPIPTKTILASPSRSTTRKSTRHSSTEPKRFETTPIRSGQGTPRTNNVNCVTRVAYKTRVGSVYGKPKLNNQDSFIIKPALKCVRGHYLFAVLDGHGSYGHNVSQFIRDSYPDLIENNLDRDLTPLSIEKSIYLSVSTLCKDLQESGIEIAFSGSTFLSIFIFGNLCVCANVGDSRAVLGRLNQSWESVALSQDHNPKRFDERMRILNSKGRIGQARNEEGVLEGPERVWLIDEDLPGLAMTRSIGDKISKAVGVTSDPEVIFRRLNSEDKFIILASDGVWEHISCEEAVQIVSKYWDDNRVDDAAVALVSEASKKWKKNEYVDDITAIVVFLNVDNN